MQEDWLKLWPTKNLTDMAIRRANEAVDRLGKALPCVVVSTNGALVTVIPNLTGTPWTLPQLTVPKAESPYFRQPVQPGDGGVLMPASAPLGHVSGQSPTPPVMQTPGNLSALVFVPVSTTQNESPFPNYAVVQSAEGVVVQSSTSGGATITVSSTGITMSAGGKTLSIDSTGITIDGILWETHAHVYTPGTGTPTDTGPPVA